MEAFAMTQQQTPRNRGGRPPSAVPTKPISMKLPTLLDQKIRDHIEANKARGVQLSRSQVIQQALAEFFERAEKGQQRELL